MRACRRPKRDSGWPLGPHGPGLTRGYFSSTTAPCASSFFLISSASALDTPSFTVPGAPSTRSLASLRPRLVIARTSLITWIFFSPPAFRMTVNSVFSSTGAAAAPPAPPAGAAAAGAAIVTPNLSLNRSISCDSSTTDRLPIASSRSSMLKLVCVAMCRLSHPVVFQGLEGPHHHVQQAVQRADESGHRRLEHADYLGEQLGFGCQRRELLHLIGRDGLAFDQADLDPRLLVLLGELRQHLRGRHGVRTAQHQRRRTGQVRLDAGALRVRQGAPRQRVLHHDVFDSGRAQLAPQRRDLGYVEPREIGDEHRPGACELGRQARHHLLLLSLGVFHW